MERAVPRLLGVVPGENAAQVRANCRTTTDASVRFPVDRDLGQSIPDHRSGAQWDLLNRPHVPAAQIADGEFAGHVQVFAEEFSDPTDRFASRGEDTPPGMVN